MPLIKPPALKNGDTVFVVASSSPFEAGSLLTGIKTLEGFGLKVRHRQDIFGKHPRHPYLAGTDERRYRELKAALIDDKVRAIVFARGGYGAVRLLPFFERDKFKPRPKIIAGFSDTTVLHLYFQKRWQWTMLYSPCIGGSLGQLGDTFTTSSFKDALVGKAADAQKFPDMTVVSHGTVRAPLVGGCLTLVTGSLGTPYEIDTDNRILFLEDVHEKPYQIDRMLMQLKMAGKFKKCRGVLFGQLTGKNPFGHYAATVRDTLSDEGFPVMMGFPTGHVRRSFTLPLGVPVEMNTRKKTITFLEAAVK